MIAVAVGALSLAIWAGLCATGFWRCSEQAEAVQASDPGVWPDVVAVVPARNEADVIARSLGSVAAQDYPGNFRVLLVDDNSDDGTGKQALTITSSRVEVISGAPLNKGWTGKLWALAQGIQAAGKPKYLWLTDADIEHAPDTLGTLVKIAESRHCKLVSFMAKLHCETLPERALVPSFVYYFMMLYPFNWINRPGPVSGAAGGCVLVDREALAAAGGIEAIRASLIDDCALGKLIKRQGPIWLGLTQRSRSIRPYRSAGEIGAMIARSAFAQLRYSPLVLAATLFGLLVMFAAPVWLVVQGEGVARGLAIGSLILMALMYQPILRHYRLSPLWGLAQPLIGLFYTGCVIASAWQHWRGRGGMWKGRPQAQAQA